jgi:hypothetical protein
MTSRRTQFPTEKTLAYANPRPLGFNSALLPTEPFRPVAILWNMHYALCILLNSLMFTLESLEDFAEIVEEFTWFSVLYLLTCRQFLRIRFRVHPMRHFNLSSQPKEVKHKCVQEEYRFEIEKNT